MKLYCLKNYNLLVDTPAYTRGVGWGEGGEAGGGCLV
jgi:hypothetical protein